MEEIVIKLSPQEIEKCLKEISVRLQRTLYVYEQSLINDNYNFKSYVYSVMLYINSFNSLFIYNVLRLTIILVKS